MIFIKRNIRNYTFLIIHCIVLVLLCSAYFNQFISPKNFPYFGIIAILFPFFFIIHLFLTFRWLVKKELIFVIFLLFTLVLFFPLKKFFHVGHQENTKSTLNILTYNVRYANDSKDLRQLESAIINKNIDIAFFQEIYTRQWRSKEIFLVDRFNAIFDLVGISSKYPIINKQKIILPGNGYACFADVVKAKDTIRCINIYLEPMFLNKNIFKIKKVDEAKEKTEIVTKKLSAGFKKHEIQIDLIKKYIKESPYPTIVCGDLNSVPLSYEYFMMKGNLQDVFELSGEGLGMTFYDYFYPIRIDYTFVSNDFVPIRSYVDKKIKFSDHYPVFSTLELKD